MAVELIAVQVHSETDIKNVIRKVGSEPDGGLFVLPDSHNVVHRKRIIELAAEYRLPAIYYFRFLRPTVASSLMAPTKWISSFAAKSAMR